MQKEVVEAVLCTAMKNSKLIEVYFNEKGFDGALVLLGLNRNNYVLLEDTERVRLWNSFEKQVWDKTRSFEVHLADNFVPRLFADWIADKLNSIRAII
jgi:hypothetical protein